MSRQTNEKVLQAHLEAENRHDIDGTLATLHEDCVFVDEPLGMRFEGRDGARQHYELWWTAFGNTLESGELHWVDDDMVIGDAVFVGRHTGAFAGASPSQRDMRLPFVVFVRFKDGLLSGERFVYDMRGLLAQLEAS